MGMNIESNITLSSILLDKKKVLSLINIPILKNE